jgi:hypothetical protein
MKRPPTILGALTSRPDRLPLKQLKQNGDNDLSFLSEKGWGERVVGQTVYIENKPEDVKLGCIIICLVMIIITVLIYILNR